MGLGKRRRSSQAGQYAEDRFRSLRGRWRRRVWRRMALFMVPLWAAALVFSWFTDGWARWYGGFFFGAFVMMFIAVWTSPPQHIERWATGAEGERRTERALRGLQRHGWQVTHDLDWPGAGNIDHLVIGPGGVYVLDSKVWGGVVSVDQAGATISPKDNPDAAWTARGEAGRMSRAGAAVARALAARTGLAVPAPTPVVVVWAPFPQRVESSGGITYVDGEHLADWLHGRPRQLHHQQAAQLAAAATADLLTAAAADKAPAGKSATT